MYYNKGRSQEPLFKEEDKIYILRKNIKTIQLNKKLYYIKIRLYKIKSKKGNIVYKIVLPKTIKIYNIFYISLLELVLLGVLYILNIKVIKESNKEQEVE